MKKIILSMLVLVAISSCSLEKTNKLIGTWEKVFTEEIILTFDKVTKTTTTTLVFKDKELSIKTAVTSGTVFISNIDEYTYTHTDNKITAKKKSDGKEMSFDYSISKKNGKEVLKLIEKVEDGIFSLSTSLEFTKK